MNRFHSFFFVLHTDGKFMRAASDQRLFWWRSEQQHHCWHAGAGVLKKVVPKIFGESK